MADYTKGSIYNILNVIDDEVYVGSTTQTLAKRLHTHKRRFLAKTHMNIKLYQHMEKHGLDNFYIELIEHYSCKTKEELRSREGHFIRQIGTLNMSIAGRNKAQYYIDTKELFKEHKQTYMKAYYEKNKERFQEQHKDNSENRKQYCKEYYQTNKDALSAKHNKQCMCECGLLYTLGHKTRHLKTRRHQELIDSKRQLNTITCECGLEVTPTNIWRHRKTDKHKQLIEQQKLTME